MQNNLQKTHLQPNIYLWLLFWYELSNAERCLVQGFLCQRGIKYLNLSLMASIQPGIVFTAWTTDAWICLKFQALTDDSLLLSSSACESILYIQYDDPQCHICVEWTLAKKADSSRALISGSSVKIEAARCQHLRSSLQNVVPPQVGNTPVLKEQVKAHFKNLGVSVLCLERVSLYFHIMGCKSGLD